MARFDNIRYLLSTMVCLCHFWSPFSGMEFMTTGVEPAKTYMFVHESMVMACFVLVSGMVASPAGSSLAPQRVRGSISLLTTFLSSLPAWQSFDPLAVLESFDEAEDDDKETLVSIVSGDE